MNLASSFVNGFVNAAFGQDKLLTDDGNKWLYKNKDHGEAGQGLELPREPRGGDPGPFGDLLKAGPLSTAPPGPPPAPPAHIAWG